GVPAFRRAGGNAGHRSKRRLRRHRQRAPRRRERRTRRRRHADPGRQRAATVVVLAGARSVVALRAQMSIDLPRPLVRHRSPALREAIASRSATVAVVGLGYVGLPLVMALDRAGFGAIGFDADQERVASLASGKSYVSDIGDAALQAGAARFTAFSRTLRQADVIVVAVPTPLTDGVPDLRMVRDACSTVAGVLRPGTLVILESTTYPGTTEEVVLPILETSGFVAGVD